MLTLEQVSFTYGGDRPAISNFSLTGSRGEFLLLIGHNGAGKSTFLKLIGGILKPTSGTITVDGKDTRHHNPAVLAKQIAVTFQNPRDQIFSSTIEGEVSFGPRILRRPNASELTEEALELFGFAQERMLHPYDLPLSRQKLLTAASAVASGSSMLAFDEPSAGLSLPERNTLLTGLKQTQGDKLVIVISHDIEAFLPLATRVVIFHRGMLSHQTDPESLLRTETLLRKAALRLPLSLRLQRLL